MITKLDLQSEVYPIPGLYERDIIPQELAGTLNLGAPVETRAAFAFERKGYIQSAGTGLNLENSANLVFIQLPWSPSEFEQASDRIYRVTQERECTIHTLFTAGTVEEHVMEVLNKKAIVTNAINAGTMAEGSTDDSFVDEVFEMML